jgi:hypothetical protein
MIMAKVNSQVQYKFIIELNDKEAISLYKLIKDWGGGMSGENCMLFDALRLELCNETLI